MNKQLALDLILEYILDSEEEHFNENPTNEHIYYLAHYLKYGKKKSELMLKTAIETLENEFFD